MNTEPMQSHPLDERITETIVSTGAPMRLRAAVEAERERTYVRRLVVRRMKISGAMAGVAAALGAAFALIAPGGGSSAPTVGDTLALAGHGRTAAAVASGNSGLLAAHVADVSFPTWRKQGLQPTGQRTDTLSGKHAVTVFYGGAAAPIAYSIVDGKLAWPSGGSVAMRSPTEIRSLTSGGRNVVVWREHGLTCVMSAPSAVPAARLVKLAAGVASYYAA